MSTINGMFNGYYPFLPYLIYWRELLYRFITIGYKFLLIFPPINVNLSQNRYFIDSYATPCFSFVQTERKAKCPSMRLTHALFDEEVTRSIAIYGPCCEGRGNGLVIYIYIYIIKKDDDDDGDITGTGRLHKRKFKRGLESERSSDNIVASRISPGKRMGEERVVERITTGRCNPLTRDFTRRLGERNN